MTDVPVTLADHVASHARTRPEAVCWAFEGRSNTYRELDDRVRSVALALLARGVRAGDRVAMLTTPRPEYLEVFLALTRIGATWVGVNPRYSDAEIAHVITTSRPVLMFCLANGFGRSGEDIQRLHETVALPPLVAVDGNLPGAVSYDEFLMIHASPADLEARRSTLTGREAAAVVYTSGTTGAPKGALLSASGMRRAAELQAARQDEPGMSVLSYLPIDHIGGLIDLGGVPLVAGGTLHLKEKFNTASVLDAIESDRINLWGGIPTIFALTLAHPRWATADVSSLSTIAWGGAAMPLGLLQELRGVGARMSTVYGLTEACVTVTYSDDNADDDVLTTTIGRPDNRLGDVRLADADGTPVALGEMGEIQLRDEGVMLGYLDDPEATAEAFTSDGYLRTGDLAIEREDHNFTLVGRIKEMFKSGGYNVYPREVELILEAFPGVQAAAVVPAVDGTFGEVGVAHVQHVGGVSIEVEALLEYCHAHLANYKVPKRVVIHDELPMRANGKVDKRALR